MAMWVSMTIRAAGNAQGLTHYDFIPEGRTVENKCTSKFSTASGM
jgi:hypothetical protein